MTRNGIIMRWNVPVVAFGTYFCVFYRPEAQLAPPAQHDSYILAFGSERIEVWNVETAEMVQKIPGRHLPLNSCNPSACRNSSPNSERIIALSDTVVDLAFRAE